MNVEEQMFPEAMTPDAIRMLEAASVQLVRALQRNALREQARDAGAREYDSWAGRLEYDSWFARFR